MDPVEAKYVGMSNIGASFFILISPFFIVYYLFNNWIFLFYEQAIFMAVLTLTFFFNNKGKFTLALVCFGSILNCHLVILSAVFGWDVKVYYLIFFTAGGAIMLFRRNVSYLIVPSVIASFVLYIAAYSLSIHIEPLYQLSRRQTAVTNSIIEVTFFVLVVINALIGRYGSIASEDQLKREVAKSIGLLQKLKDADRQKTLFFQNISHEFRTPLTLIMGPLESILMDGFCHLERSVKEQLLIVQRNAGRLLGLINQLLDLSKLDENKMRLKMVRGNISALVADTVASFQGYAEKLEIQLSMADTFQELQMNYDPQMIEKVLTNLISNALKFTAGGGWIRVSLSKSNDGKEIVISVKDSGRGIPQKELPFIFDRFHQADGSITRNQEGTGIGLNLAKGFVELHGGRIEVASAVNKGTEFRVYLPTAAAMNEQHPAEDIEAPNGGEDIYFYERSISERQSEDELPSECADNRKAHVLIVDDNKDMRQHIRRILDRRYFVSEAVDGKEGLQKALEIVPDIILSDVMMPKMDGYEFCRRIGSSDVLRDVPVILITARASEEMMVEGLSSGAYEYITKPFSQKVLLAKIDSILDRLQEHKKQVQYDGLTGLLNRESWLRQVSREFERNKRNSETFSIAFIDLDDFKKVNDTYSHQTGDEVLKGLSLLMRKHLRVSDLTGRFGGEEFVVYFPSTTGQAAVDSLGRILQLFSRLKVEGRHLFCTFSSGVVERTLDQDLTLDAYLAMADEAMYDAKKGGKASVSLSQNFHPSRCFSSNA